VQRYRFGLSHNELKADLSSMLEQYRCEMDKNNKRPSLQRITRMMKKRKALMSKSPQHHNTDNLINTTIDMTQSSEIKKEFTEIESDSSADESLLYQIHANMHGLPPLGFLNDPSCTVHQLRKSKRNRKPVVSISVESAKQERQKMHFKDVKNERVQMCSSKMRT